MHYRGILLASCVLLLFGLSLAAPSSSLVSRVKDGSSSPDLPDPPTPPEAQFESSDVKNKWATPEEIVEAVLKHGHKAVFWSGSETEHKGKPQARRVSVRAWAAKWAQDNDGMTLEMILHDMQESSNGMKRVPVWDANDKAVADWWGAASTALAEGSSGIIRVVLGSELRPGNIWETYELKALKDNTEVKKIMKINGFKTDQPTVLWERPGSAKRSPDSAESKRSPVSAESKRNSDNTMSKRSPAVKEVKGWSLVRDGSAEGFYQKGEDIEYEVPKELTAKEAQSLGGTDKFVATKKVKWAAAFKEAKPKVKKAIEKLKSDSSSDSDSKGGDTENNSGHTSDTSNSDKGGNGKGDKGGKRSVGGV